MQCSSPSKGRTGSRRARRSFVVVALLMNASALGCSPAPTSQLGLASSDPGQTPNVDGAERSSSGALAEAPSATTVPRTQATAQSEPPPAGWPLPDSCTEPSRCKTAAGEPGVQCDEKSQCVNPCRKGMAPNDAGMFCEKLCKSDAECPGGKCLADGVCEAFPVFTCSRVKDCTLDDGHVGARCKAKDPCLNPCKPGLFQSPNGDCAKPCTGPAGCPGGACVDGWCGPTCPAKSCPYLWE